MTTVSITSEQGEKDAEKESDEIINSVTHCIERGEGQGKCHVFLDHSTVCECKSIDLEKSRMK